MFATILITLALIFVAVNLATDACQASETEWAATLEIIDRAEYQPLDMNPESGAGQPVQAWVYHTIRNV